MKLSSLRIGPGPSLSASPPCSPDFPSLSPFSPSSDFSCFSLFSECSPPAEPSLLGAACAEGRFITKISTPRIIIVFTTKMMGIILVLLLGGAGSGGSSSAGLLIGILSFRAKRGEAVEGRSVDRSVESLGRIADQQSPYRSPHRRNGANSCLRRPPDRPVRPGSRHGDDGA